MSRMPSIFGDSSSAERASARGPASDAAIPTLRQGLIIWWAFFWRNTVTSAIIYEALDVAIRPLLTGGGLPYGPFLFFLSFGPLAINFTVAILELHFILEKEFKTFRVALISSDPATAGQVVPATFSRTIQVWWAYAWRTFLYSVAVIALTSIPVALFLSAIGTMFPRLDEVFRYLTGVAIQGAVGLYVIYSNILDENIGDFRVSLLPKDASEHSLPA